MSRPGSPGGRPRKTSARARGMTRLEDLDAGRQASWRRHAPRRAPAHMTTPVATATGAPRTPTHPSGTSQSVPSGGMLSSAECDCPIHGIASASTPPMLPTSEPPYTLASVFTTSRQRPPCGKPRR